MPPYFETLTFHSDEHTLQRYFVSTIASLPSAASIVFRLLNVYSLRPHFGQVFLVRSILGVLRNLEPIITRGIENCSDVLGAKWQHGLNSVSMQLNFCITRAGDGRFGQGVPAGLASFPYYETFVSCGVAPRIRHEVPGGHSGFSNSSAAGVDVSMGSA